MVGVGFVVLFAGYTLVTYGWSQLQGSNAGLLGLVWPGKFNGPNPDAGKIAVNPSKYPAGSTDPNTGETIHGYNQKGTPLEPLNPKSSGLGAGGIAG